MPEEEQALIGNLSEQAEKPEMNVPDESLTILPNFQNSFNSKKQEKFVSEVNDDYTGSLYKVIYIPENPKYVTVHAKEVQQIIAYEELVQLEPNKASALVRNERRDKE